MKYTDRRTIEFSCLNAERALKLHFVEQGYLLGSRLTVPGRTCRTLLKKSISLRDVAAQLGTGSTHDEEGERAKHCEAHAAATQLHIKAQLEAITQKSDLDLL